MSATWTISIDNGSTFTDGCLFADGVLTTVKVLTTPYDLMSCFTDVFRALARESGVGDVAALMRQTEEVRYSTTSGTNALLVRRGVRVGLVTGTGDADRVYGLRDQNAELVDALVGDRVVELDFTDDAERDARILLALRTLLARGAQWAVVSLPDEAGAEAERTVKRRLMRLMPGHLLGAVPVLYSRELCADPADARRTGTALLNGFLHRETARFLYHADGWARERHVVEPLRIMRNDGGCGRVAKTTAVKTLDSGPMGGLIGAGFLARSAGENRLVTCDVGGTSSDLGLVENGEPIVDRFGSVHGLALSFSFPALRTAALGGGSIFRVEKGSIAIGPESAGALPGPACFGRGGEDPTLTDAALVAGLLDASAFAAGAITVRTDLAEQALVTRIAGPLGLEGPAVAAEAMLAAFTSKLASEIGAVLDSRGWNPAETALLAFGGSGPLVAGRVAAELGLARWIVPEAAASFSALGVGFAERGHAYRAMLDAPLDPATLDACVNQLRDRAGRDLFGEGIAAGGAAESLTISRESDGAEVSREDAARVTGRVVVDLRVSVEGSGLREFAHETETDGASAEATRAVLVGEQRRDVAVLASSRIREAGAGGGPVLVESPYWSAPVPEGWSWSSEPFGIRVSR